MTLLAGVTSTAIYPVGTALQRMDVPHTFSQLTRWCSVHSNLVTTPLPVGLSRKLIKHGHRRSRVGIS